MRFNVPLLPLDVDIRSRPLPRFRFSLRSLALTLAGAALFFALVVELDRVNRRYGFHATEALRLLLPGQTKLTEAEASVQRWHSQLANEYLAARTWLEVGTGLIAIAAIVLMLVAAIGRVLNLMVPPASVAPQDKPR
jgi:hypothetical protein